MDAGTPLVGIERRLDVEPSVTLAFAEFCRLPLVPDVLGLDGSSRDRPGVFKAGRPGGPGEHSRDADVYVWELSVEEFRSFVEVAQVEDDEDSGFAALTLDRAISGDGGNLRLALGIAPGVMSGFLVRDRTLSVAGESDIRYGFDCDRAYLLPQVRGKGLSKAIVAISRIVFVHEMRVLAEGLASRPAETRLTPVLSGYADSDGGARMLNQMASEMEAVYGSPRDGPGGVGIGELRNDVDSYTPEAMPSP